jgi:hypothetical protein
VLATTKFFRPWLVALTWVLTSLLSLMLLSAPHAGASVYYLFLVVGWPFIYYDHHMTVAGLCVSVAGQLLYVSVVQPLLFWLYRTIEKA